MAPSCKTSSEDSTANSAPRSFRCRHCSKSFSNGQALGGHQNAHRLDMGLMKTLKEILATYREQFPGNSSSPSVAAAPKLLPSAEVITGHGVVMPAGRLIEPELPGEDRTIDLLKQWKPICADPIVPVEIEENLDLELKLGF